MPWKKDYVSIERNVHVQKRLILSNLRELFVEFKTEYPSLKVRTVDTFLINLHNILKHMYNLL